MKLAIINVQVISETKFNVKTPTYIALSKLSVSLYFLLVFCKFSGATY